MSQPPAQRPIKEGYLTKEGHIVKNWKRRWFVLLSDRMVYYESSDTTQPSRGTVFLNGSDIAPFTHVTYNYCFRITRTPTGKDFVIYADSSKDYNEWLTLLRAASAGISVTTPVRSSTAGKSNALAIALAQQQRSSTVTSVNSSSNSGSVGSGTQQPSSDLSSPDSTAHSAPSFSLPTAQTESNDLVGDDNSASLVEQPEETPSSTTPATTTAAVSESEPVEKPVIQHASVVDTPSPVAAVKAQKSFTHSPTGVISRPMSGEYHSPTGHHPGVRSFSVSSPISVPSRSRSVSVQSQSAGSGTPTALSLLQMAHGTPPTLFDALYRDDEDLITNHRRDSTSLREKVFLARSLSGSPRSGPISHHGTAENSPALTPSTHDSDEQEFSPLDQTQPSPALPEMDDIESAMNGDTTTTSAITESLSSVSITTTTTKDNKVEEVVASTPQKPTPTLAIEINKPVNRQLGRTKYSSTMSASAPEPTTPIAMIAQVDSLGDGFSDEDEPVVTRGRTQTMPMPQLRAPLWRPLETPPPPSPLVLADHRLFASVFKS